MNYPKITRGQLVWLLGSNNTIERVWFCPGIVTEADDTTFTIMMFDEFKEVQYNLADYPNLADNGRAKSIVAGEDNEISFIKKDLLENYIKQQQIVKQKRSHHLHKEIEQLLQTLEEKQQYLAALDEEEDIGVTIERHYKIATS